MKTGIYRHYKGGEYEVLGVAFHTETEEKMVVYHALYDCPDLADEYGERPYFVRPYKMFTGLVNVDGVDRPRFDYVGEK